MFVLRQLTGNLKEALLPYISDKLKVYRMTYKTASQVTLDADSGLQHGKDEQESSTSHEDASEYNMFSHFEDLRCTCSLHVHAI